METILYIGVLALFGFLVWQVFALVGDMARDRGKDPVPWWILSIFWSPFGSMLILWAFYDRKDGE